MLTLISISWDLSVKGSGTNACTLFFFKHYLLSGYTSLLSRMVFYPSETKKMSSFFESFPLVNCCVTNHEEGQLWSYSKMNISTAHFVLEAYYLFFYELLCILLRVTIPFFFLAQKSSHFSNGIDEHMLVATMKVIYLCRVLLLSEFMCVYCVHTR